MTDALSFNDLLEMLVAIGGVLGIFTGIILWAVKSQVTSLREDNHKSSASLQRHIDGKIDKVVSDIRLQSKRLDDHDRLIQDQKLAQLELRNEMLENMRAGYVRHDDIVDINSKLSTLFARLDKLIFRNTGS